MSDSQSSKIESEIQINAKDNASSSINKVTTSIKKLGDQVISVDDLITKLSVNVIDAAQSIDRSFGSIDTKKLTEINKAMSLPMEAERSKAKNNLDKAKAKEISTKTKNGYYDAETELMLAKAAHAGDQLAISLNKLQEQIERQKGAEFRYLAASKNYDTALLKKDYWDAQAKFKGSDDFYRQVRSMNAARDARTQRWLEEGQNKSRMMNRTAISGGLSRIGGSVSSFNDPAGVSKVLGNVAQSFGNVLSASTKLGAGLTTAAEATKMAAKLFNEAISAFQNIEVIKTNLGVISGSNIEGESLFQDIAKYAVKSPFGIQQTAEQATLLKQSGVYADDLMDTLKMVGDLAGGNADKMRRISNDYAHIVSNGKANMLQLRQFATAGIPIYKELSKELNVSNETVRKMVKNGEIGASTIEKVLKNLTSEGGTFYQAVEKGSKTLKARTTNLQDIRTLAFSELGRGIVDIGRNDKNESILERMLGSMEEFFKKYYEDKKEKNDKKDYERFKKNEEKIAELEQKYKNVSSNPEEYGSFIPKEVLAELNKVKRAYGSEESQQILFNEYQNRISRIKDLNAVTPFIEEEINRLKEEMNAQLERGEKSAAKVTAQYIKDYEDSRTDHFNQLTNEKNGVSSRMYESAFNAYFDNTYKSSSEILEKGTKADKSLWAVTDEMMTLYKQTAEYKEKEEAAQKEIFANVKAVATELDKITKEVDGKKIVDLSKINSVDDFKKFSQLLSSDEQFNLKQSSYNLLDQNDVARAEEVNTIFQDALENALRIARTAGDDIKNEGAYGSLYNRLSSLTGKHFIDDSMSFNRMFDEYKEMLDAFSNGSGGDKMAANFFKSIINPMISGTLVGNTKAKDIDLSFGNEILPLWARILGSGLGLDASMVKNAGGAKTLQLHEQEQYSRNITKNILSTGAKNGASAETLLGMMSIYNPKKYKADAAGVAGAQIDWTKTRDNVKAFALQIGQAAEVTSSYRQSVESEIDTLSELLSNMPTTFEDAKNVKGFDQMFLNAFTGEVQVNGKNAYYDATTKLVTALDGTTYSIDDVKDQITFTEGSVKELTRQLKDRRNDLIEAKRAESINSAYSSAVGDYQDKYLGYLASTRYGFKEGSAQYNNFVNQGKTGLDHAKFEDYTWSKQRLEYIAGGKEIDNINAENKALLNAAMYDAQDILKRAEATFKDYEDFKIDAENEDYKRFVSKNSDLKKFTLDEVKKLIKDIPEMKKDFDSFQEYERLRGYDVINNMTGDKTHMSYAEILKEYNSAKSAYEKALKDEEEARKAFEEAKITNYEQERKDEVEKEGMASMVTNPAVLDKFGLQGIKYNAQMLTTVDENFEEFNKLIAQLGVANSANFKTSSTDYSTLSADSVYGSGKGYMKNRFYTGRYGISEADSKYAGKAYSDILYKNFMDDYAGSEQYLNQLSNGNLGSQIAKVLGNKVTEDGVEVFKYNRDELDALSTEALKYMLQLDMVAKKTDEVRDGLLSTFEDFGTNMITDTFKTIGTSIRDAFDPLNDAADSWKELGKNFVSAVSEMTGQMGDLMITAGLSQIIKGGESGLGIGLALLAAGGLSNIVSGMLDTKDDNDDEERIKKLENLKADLKDLIAQAKNDAIYYEKNMSHKKALTTSQAISVNDAIITPSGNVISTHPDDYLIATKTPDTLMGGKGNSQPIINVNIKNNTDQKLTVTQTKTESNGEINIEAIIEGVVGKGIAEGQFDGALSARETRLHGSRVYM